MANRYWVGGGSSASWAATGNTNWGTASNTRDNASVPGSADDVFFDGVGFGASNCTISTNVTAKSVNFTGYTNTLTHNNNSQLTISGSLTMGAGMTYSPASSATFSFPTNGTVTTNGILMQVLSQTSGSVTTTLGDNLNFTATKTAVLSGPGTINMNGFSINGNSATNRVLISSSTLGTARTISNATTSFSNADFRDITFSSASSLDLSAITGLSGDCGGNTITGGGSTLTFTTAATQTATGSSANWSTATWTSRVPLPQDDVVISLTAGQTITSDMPRLGKSISFTTATNWTQTLAHTMYGSLDLTGMGTLTESSSSLDLEGRTSGLTVTSAGKSHTRAFRIASVGGVYTFQDAFSSTNQLQHSYGTLTVNNVNIQASSFTNNILTSTRVMNMGSGTWTLTGTGTIWSMFTTSFTLNSETSTIISSDVSVTAKTFSGQSLVYNNFSITGGGSGAVTITGSNTFNTLTIGSPKTVTLTSGTTQTVSNFVATGTAGNVITLNAPTLTTTPPILSTTNGYMNCQYVNVQGVNVTPAGRWFSGNKNAHLGLNFGGQTSSGDYVSAANSASGNQIYGATSFSTESWSVPRGQGGLSFGGILFHADQNGTIGGYATSFYSTSNRIRSGISEGGSYKTSQSNISFTFNTLYHIVTTWTSGSAIKIYLNGVETSYTSQTAITTPSDDSAYTLNIGNWSGRTTTWDGQIYVVRIYRNVELSAANVTTLYNGGVMTKQSNPLGNATAEYLFNEGTGSTLTDSINSVNGTITGADWSNTGWRAGSSMDMFRSLY